MGKRSGAKYNPPPPAAPSPTLITDHSDVIMQSADEQRRRLRQKGYEGSILTGLLGAAPSERKSLLG